MPTPPYTGPETKTSLRVLEELAPGMPEPIMLLGGWGVYFTVRNAWRNTFGEDYFGSRDIDLGFHTPGTATLAELQAGNLPRTIAHLETHGFSRQGMYQFLRFHDHETNEAIGPEEAARMPGFAYYSIAVDLIIDEQRPDARDIAQFQAFAEPMLRPAFTDAMHRRIQPIRDINVQIPAPHVMLAMKLTSLPQRQKDDKSIKDLCDIYALITASSDDPRTLRSRLHRLMPRATDAVRGAAASPFLNEAAYLLEAREELVARALQQLA